MVPWTPTPTPDGSGSKGGWPAPKRLRVQQASGSLRKGMAGTPAALPLAIAVGAQAVPAAGVGDFPHGLGPRSGENASWRTLVGRTLWVGLLGEALWKGLPGGRSLEAFLGTVSLDTGPLRVSPTGGAARRPLSPWPRSTCASVNASAHASRGAAAAEGHGRSSKNSLEKALLG